MSNDLLRSLIEASVASSMAITLVALLRRPLRHFLGARPAYWLWLLVPMAVLAVWLPSPTASSLVLGGELPVVIAGVTGSTAAALSVDSHGATWLAAWVAGCLLAVTVLAHLQRAFVAAMGKLRRDSNGILRSRTMAGPAVIGAWRPRLVLPDDFEARYNDDEQLLILAHEQAHLRRSDALFNALAALGICLFWFNPLIYWAASRFRFDQELACDAEVLSCSGTSRRRYADAMLKTQLAVDAAWRLPVGCHWQSCHPLKERISMLKRPLPSPLRRRSGTVLAIAISVVASYAAWARSPAEPPTKAHEQARQVEAVSVPPPRYPAGAVQSKTSGRVVLEILVAEDGSAREVHVVSSTPAGVFDQVSIDAARGWKFTPGKTSARIRIPVDFSPDGPPAS